jgi:mRNA-degrading endonuclease RelE of RelBE toxin-antitoxin system
MPKREVLYEGEFHTVELAITANGRCPGKEFLKSLSKGERTKVLKIIERLADEGKVASREQFKKIEGENFFEFKKFQIRIPCYFQPGGRIIITHGFKKKGESIGPDEIKRMKRIRDEYEQRT